MKNLRKYTKSMRCKPGAAKEDILLVEKQVGFVFPDDFKNFLLECNGAEGPIGNSSYLVLWSLNDIVTLNTLYGFPEFAKDLVGFGTTGGGECFAFSREKSWVIQIPLGDFDESARIIISDSFEDFIENYEERKFKKFEK